MENPEKKWNADAQMRLHALPRESSPPPAVKNRTRAALRTRGLLRPASARTISLHWSLTLAAAVMIFALGGLAGRATGGDRSHAASRITRQSSLAPAEDVQRAGTRYVETVAALAAATDTLPSETASQGRQVALSALRGAAEQLLYLPGNDRRTEQLLQELRSPAP